MIPVPIRCLIAAPEGDIVPQGQFLNLPLEGSDEGVSYASYFAGIKAFLTGPGAKVLARLAAVQGETLTGVVIRAEKHGALYHPASLELSLGSGRRIKLALAVATCERGREALLHEQATLTRLGAGPARPWLPRVHAFHSAADMSFLLEEWLEGFHEFHASEGGAILLWTYGQGLRQLSLEQSARVFHRIGAILADCYDAEDGRCIQLWHLAAGDFIAQDSPEPEVRLCTVRSYAPFIDATEACPPALALLLFFLDTTLRVRLDRVDGVNEIVWLDEALLHAAIAGVCDSLRHKNRPELDPVALTRLFCSFNAKELSGVLAALEDGFSPRELEYIAPRLDAHLQAARNGLLKACKPPPER